MGSLGPLYDSGQYAELTGVILANSHYPMLVYNLARAESLSGRTGAAIEHVRQAIGAAEKFRHDARIDTDLDPLRQEPAFQSLISANP